MIKKRKEINKFDSNYPSKKKNINKNKNKIKNKKN
jgi:hypothetical protein